MNVFVKDAGKNFASWEHRIDHQLAFAHSRIDILKFTVCRGQAERIGVLQGRCDRLERRVTQLDQMVARLQLAVFLLIALVLVVAAVAVAGVVW